MSKFKKGDLVRVLSPSRVDSEAGLEPMTVGTVFAYLGEDEYTVSFDGFEPKTDTFVRPGGWWMLEDQLELVEAAPAQAEPPATAPVYVLTNAELQTAIEQTHVLMRASGFETAENLRGHLNALLRVQLARATSEAAA